MTGFIFSAVLLLIAGFLFYRRWKVNAGMKALRAQKFQRIKSVVDKFDNGQIPTADEVRPFAFNIATREAIYELLKEKGNLALFPPELLTIEKGAEANLANWLEFPTELDALPDELEHVERVIIPFDKDNEVFYHVFKFRVHEPHWASKDGWILGVVGPYFSDSKPFDFPGATFSRFSSKFGTIAPKDEAKWVHDNLAMKR